MQGYPNAVVIFSLRVYFQFENLFIFSLLVAALVRRRAVPLLFLSNNPRSVIVVTLSIIPNSIASTESFSFPKFPGSSFFYRMRQHEVSLLSF